MSTTWSTAFDRLMDTPDDDHGPDQSRQSRRVHDPRAGREGHRPHRLESKMIRKPLPADDPMQRKPDIAFAKKTLGWEPKINLEAGLKKTIAYFENLLRDELKTAKRAAKPSARAKSSKR
jgi:UDP-glucuronate decarboxylase